MELAIGFVLCHMRRFPQELYNKIFSFASTAIVDNDLRVKSNSEMRVSLSLHSI